MGNLIHCISGSHPKQWDTALAQTEFAFNNMKNKSIGKTPFEVVYLSPPRLTLDLVSLPHVPGFSHEAKLLAEQVTKIHNEVTQNLERANTTYKSYADAKRREQNFEVGDLIM